MTWTPDEAQQIGRMEGTLDGIAGSLSLQEPRVSALEAWSNRIRGALKIVAVTLGIGGPIVAALLLAGCTHMHAKEYFESGELKSSVLVTVLGTGEVNALSEDGDIIYESSATGISDNGAKLIEDAVAAAVKASLPVPVP